MTLLNDIFVNQYYNKYFILEKIVVSKKRGNTYKYRCMCGKERISNADSIRKNSNNTRCRCSEADTFDQMALVQIWNKYKHCAKRKSIKFSLSKAKLYELVQGNCHYCSRPPSNSFHRHGDTRIFKYNGLDRKNNEEYSDNGCVSCCWECNDTKGNRTYEEFLTYIKTVHNNLFKGEKDV
jgi:hypothetical protein